MAKAVRKAQDDKTKTAYSYLRHDYQLVNCWCILKALYYWKKKDVLKPKIYNESR